MTSVGTPEFESADSADAVDILLGHAPDGPERSPEPPTRAAIGLAVGVVAIVLALFVLTRSTEPRAAETTSPTIPSTTTIAAEPDELFAVQQASLRYSTREVTERSVYAAGEGGGGFFGVGRFDGTWFPMTSVDGLEWVMLTAQPLVGVPDGFRPGAPRWGRDVVQVVDNTLWMQVGSQQLAGAEWATILMRSTDGISWERAEEIPDWFLVDPIERFREWVPQSELARRIPDLEPTFDVVDFAETSHGLAALFHDRGEETFRLAISRNGDQWETIGLEERGEAAVEIVVVGRDEVLLRAADGRNRSTELLVPFPIERDDAPSYERAPVDPVVAFVHPDGSDYVGFVASSTSPGNLDLVRSVSGLTWTRNNGTLAEGLPDGADPVGIWGDGKVVAAFANVAGTELAFAAGLTSRGDQPWEARQVFESEHQIRPGLVVLDPEASLLSIEERSRDGELIEVSQFLASRDLSWREELPSDFGFVTAATSTNDGLLALVWQGGPSLDPSVAELRIYQDGEWSDFLMDNLEGWKVQALASQGDRIIAFTFDGVRQFDPFIGTWVSVGANREIEVTEDIVEREIFATKNGAAILFSRDVPPENGMFFVQVTRDYQYWETVFVAEELITLTIKTLGQDEVLLEGLVSGAGPRRIRVPLP